MGAAAPTGELEFWLTRFRPGWNTDGLHHSWPDFHLDAQFVSVRKEPDPCRLFFRIEGLAAQPVDLVAACPELIDAPAGVRGVQVQLQWGAGVVTLRLNGREVAQALL